MRKLILTIVLIGLFPLSALAQEKAPAPDSPATPDEFMESIDTSRVLVIGAGIIAGAIALEAIAVGDLSVLAGAVIGGLVADWWYGKAHPHLTLNRSRFQRSAEGSTKPKLLRMAAATSRH